MWRHLFMALLLVPQWVQAQAEVNCKVLDPALQGRYEGPCLNGLAQGLGEAVGGATRYRGDFVAGRKHGLCRRASKVMYVLLTCNALVPLGAVNNSLDD